MANSEKFKTLFDPATYDCCRICYEPLEGKVEVCPCCGGDPLKTGLLYTHSQMEKYEISKAQKVRQLLKKVNGCFIKPDEYFYFK